MQIDTIGSYRLAARSGACAGIAAGGAVFAFRWTDAIAKARIRAILRGAAGVGAWFVNVQWDEVIITG